MTNPSPETINKIVAMTQGGHPLPIIARALGINADHINEWIEAGQQGKNVTFQKFAVEYDKALALYEIDTLEKLKAHAKTDAAAAFKLRELQEKQRETPKPDSIPLDNSMWEAFVQLLASRIRPGKAYHQLNGGTAASAAASATRLLKNVKVQSRLRFLKMGVHQSRTLTRERRLEICYEAAHSPTTTHDTRLRAAKLDAELKGEMIGKQELTGQDGTPLPSALPTIIFTERTHCGRRKTNA